MNRYFKKFSIMFVMLLAIIGVGVIENGTVANADTGWQRYGKTSKYITYKGNWPVTTQSNYHDAYTTDKSAKLEFAFTGTKLRYYSLGYTNHTNQAVINIDGKDYTFAQHKDFAVDYCLDFEINNLENTTHNVIVSKKDDLVLSFQAIDIDSTGVLKQYSESITLDKSSMNLTKGNSKQLTATTTPVGVPITWTSSNPLVATVDSNGNVTAVGEGQVTITATTNDSYAVSSSCVVNVTKEIEEKSITLDKSSMNLAEDNSEQLTATTTPIGIGVKWTTSDPSIATVDQNGKITAIKEGTCTITATTTDGLTANCTITVTKKSSSNNSGTTSGNTCRATTNSYGILNLNTPSGFTQNNNNGGNGNSSNNSGNTNNSGNSGNNYSNNNNSNSNNNYYYYNNYNIYISKTS